MEIETAAQMNKPEMFHLTKHLSQHDSRQTLEDYASSFKWRAGGGDSVLDAGCGPGDVTTEVLLPFLPANFKRLVGADVSTEMVEFCRRTYSHPKLSFEQFNFDQALEQQPFCNVEQFDHIFSFYCLHFIQNQKLCLQNFYKLLNPGGDLLVLFLAKHVNYDVMKIQSKDSRWASYMMDVEKHLTPYQFSKNPGEEFRNLLNECGFTGCDVRILEKNFIHTTDSINTCVHSVNPFIDRIPPEQKQTYLDDLLQQVREKCYVRDDIVDNQKTNQYLLPHTLLIAYARKPN